MRLRSPKSVHADVHVIVAAVAVSILAACHTVIPAPVAPAAPGVSIAIYAPTTLTGSGGAPAAARPGYAVVDDRRWVDVSGPVLSLDDIDPGAALPSLVIEPLAGAPLAIGACGRDRLPTLAPSSAGDSDQLQGVDGGVEGGVVGGTIYDVPGRRRPTPPLPAPPPTPPLVFSAAGDFVGPTAGPVYTSVVRCAVTGAPGRRLIRALYVSTTLTSRGEHDVAVTAENSARVATRFAITTPPWRPRDGAPVYAEVTLYDGAPGGDHPPVELVRGRIVVDGSTAVLAQPVRDVPARLRRIYDGAIPSDPAVPPTEQEWNLGSQDLVWVWLELPGTTLPPGEIHIHTALPGEGVRDLVVGADVGAADASGAPGSLRMPLWVDDDLHGTRKRVPYAQRMGRLGERIALGVVNLGDTPREVWIEERLRPAHKRVVSHAVPEKPALHVDTLRTHVMVKPGEAQRVSYVVDYTF